MSGMDTEFTTSDRLRRGARQWLVWVLMAIAVLAALAWAIGRLEPSLRRSRIHLGTVDRGDLDAVLTANGIVEPAREQVISSRVEGRVLRVVSQPGALLVAGDPVLELDVGQTTLDVERLRGEQQQKASERRELQLRLEERLIDLRSQLAVRELDLEELAYQVEQDQRLFEEGLISETQLRATLVRQRKAEIERKKVSDSVDNSRLALAEQIAGVEAQLRTLGGELADAEQRAAMAVTRADRDGVLTFVAAEVGATVHPGDVLARIADPDSFRVEATIADVYATRLRVGQPVRLPIGELELAGTLTRILPAIDQGALRFWVELAEPSHPSLRANLRADVLVVVEHKDAVLRVPKGPATAAAGSLRVFVLDGGVAHRRDVRLGLSGYRHYEVVEGLEDGEVVILSDTSRFVDMDEVKVRG